MLYRTTWRTFLIHMIDWFSLEEILHIEWVIVSCRMMNKGINNRISKPSELWPSLEIVDYYSRTEDLETCKRMYFSDLQKSDNDGLKYSSVELNLYSKILNPVDHHHDVCLICSDDETWVLDMLCEYLKTRMHLECINLDKLFKDGKLGPIYLDMSDMHDTTVAIRKEWQQEEEENESRTADGRRKLLDEWSTKKKLKKLKELGIKVEEHEKHLIDQMLIDAWVT